MKKLSLIILLFSILNNYYSQIIWDNEKKIAKMEGVIITDSLSISDQYERGKVWIVSNLKSSDNNILFDDLSKNKIIATGNILLKNKQNFLTPITNRILNFKISVFFKKGKFKYYISNVITTETYHLSDGSTKIITKDLNSLFEKQFRKKKKKRKKIQEEVDGVFIGLINSLTSSIKTPLEENSNDW